MKNKKLLALILLLAIGFAAVSTTLVINGTTRVAENNSEFEVYFSNAVENGKTRKSLIKDDTHISFTVDMKSVGEKYELEYAVTNGSKNYDAALALEHTQTNEYVKIINVFDTDNNLLATETRTGTLTIEVTKPYVGTDENPTKEIEVTLTITANAVERESLATGTPNEKIPICTLESPLVYEKGNWKYTDNDCSYDLTNGDLISLSTESFYVYDIEGDNVKAIAQYNLYVGRLTTSVGSGYSGVTSLLENPTGYQNKNARGRIFDNDGNNLLPFVGVVPFTSKTKINMLEEGQKPNDYSISDIKEQVDAYGTKLNEFDGEVIAVRLITEEELVMAGCNLEKSSCKAGYSYSGSGWIEAATVTGAPEYLWSTSYWTSSNIPFIAEDTGVRNVYSDGHFDWNLVDNDSNLGVRPVIELSKSLFE